MIVKDEKIIFNNLVSASSPNRESKKITINRETVKPFSAENSEGSFCQFNTIEDLHDSAKTSAENYKILK